MNKEIEFIHEYLKKSYNENKISLDDIDFDEFGIKFAPFVNIINYWSQLLTLTISKSSDPNTKLNNCEKSPHVETFKLFILECVNYKLTDIIKELNFNPNSLKPNFNSEIFESNPLIGSYKIAIKEYVDKFDFNDCCQMLGAIGYVYRMISADINSYYKQKTGLNPFNNYALHEVLDINNIKYNDLFESNSKPINTDNLDWGLTWITNLIGCLINLN
jgi:hypothetical protein